MVEDSGRSRDPCGMGTQQRHRSGAIDRFNGRRLFIGIPGEVRGRLERAGRLFFTDKAIGSLDGLTAFGALPNAPVLPVEQRRHPLGALRAALRRRQHAARPTRATTATIATNPCA